MQIRYKQVINKSIMRGAKIYEKEHQGAHVLIFARVHRARTAGPRGQSSPVCYNRLYVTPVVFSERLSIHVTEEDDWDSAFRQPGFMILPCAGRPSCSRSHSPKPVCSDMQTSVCGSGMLSITTFQPLKLSIILLR